MRFDSLTLRGIGPFHDEVTLDLTAIPGKLIAITGANGAGKSVLLEAGLAGACYRKTPTRGTLGELAVSREAFVETRVTNGRSYIIRQTIDSHTGKGESLVLDAETGTPLVESGKRRDFDAWAKEHLPPAEVLYASTFGAQGSGGFLDLDPAPRKQVVMRVLGHAHLDGLSKAAGERARAAKAKLDTCLARIADEKSRGGDVAELKLELVEAESTSRQAHIDLHQAEATLVAAREADANHLQAMASWHRNNDQRSDLEAASARLTEELQRCVDLAAARGERALADIASDQADEQLVAAEKTRDEWLLAHDKHRTEMATWERDSAARSSLLEQRAKAMGRSSDLDGRVFELRKTLNQADAIYAAAALRTKLEGQLAALDERLAAATNQLDFERERQGQLGQAEHDHGQTATAAEQRLTTATERRGGLASDIDQATAELPEARHELRRVRDSLQAGELELGKLQALRLEGKDGRISGLRGDMESIADVTTDDPQTQARAGLDRDAALGRELAGLPAKLAAVEAKVGTDRTGSANVDGWVNRLEAVEARRPELEQLDADAKRAKDDRTRALSARDLASKAIADSCEIATKAADDHAAAGADRVTVADKFEQLTDLAAKAPALEQAKAQLEALEPQHADAQAELDQLDAKREEAPDVSDTPPMPPAITTAGAEAPVKDARDAAQECAQRVELARVNMERAEADSARQGTLKTELAQVAGQLDVIGSQTPAPQSPDPVDEAPMNAARAAAQESDIASTRAADALERAQQGAKRLDELAAERSGLEAQLGDWRLLERDLGRNGVQALELDAAGPELTELANDLLHNCLGPRFSVRVESTRKSADGKKDLEGCWVYVYDAEANREAEARTFSGGEKVLIGEAMNLAITMLGVRHAGLSDVTIIRDETGAALDGEKGRAYIAMLRRAAELVGASKVLFVTHDQELQELADSRVVVRDGGISTCEPEPARLYRHTDGKYVPDGWGTEREGDAEVLP